jgi:catechol 2,3-dioxygenase-like lactoylglutathione lyase family enzyme
MPQWLSVVTLGVGDLQASKAFYLDGFGWTPVFENAEIVFYQMNGLVLGTWLKAELERDMQRAGPTGSGAVALAHNVSSEAEVRSLVDRLVGAGGRLLRAPDAPPHGGFRGYVADPDGHAWEIAWNPAWPIDDLGNVTFAV